MPTLVPFMRVLVAKVREYLDEKCLRYTEIGSPSDAYFPFLEITVYELPSRAYREMVLPQMERIAEMRDDLSLQHGQTHDHFYVFKFNWFREPIY